MALKRVISSAFWFISNILSFPSMKCVDKQDGGYKVLSLYLPKHGSYAEQNLFKRLQMCKNME